MKIRHLLFATVLSIMTCGHAAASSLNKLGPSELESIIIISFRELGYHDIFISRQFCDQHEVHRCVYKVGTHLLIVTAENWDKRISNLVLRQRWFRGQNRELVVEQLAQAFEMVTFLIEGKPAESLLSNAQTKALFTGTLKAPLQLPESTIQDSKNGNHIDVIWRLSTK